VTGEKRANRSKENQNLLELVTDKEDLQARSKCPKKF
jgi:hypothetical protein